MSEPIVSITMCPLDCLGNSTMSLIEVSLINHTACTFPDSACNSNLAGNEVALCRGWPNWIKHRKFKYSVWCLIDPFLFTVFAL